ncbi:MAG: Rv0623 family protein transcription factor [Hydrocarboniphaga sp.]|uniref:type II toxin-antitoxin system VapB family antitoxin n=1 Tax=Hydrocarboniphaga sp. TaxID=2033016 RepID=UPI0026236825|nr:type II toxin-antitoxin system VapB family antitoxin [Hydrocarboniphaga sp.]MDB5970958.1 Rv0623 family protein transcription factor [Hydrocarboniphaga sp.]
MAMQIANPAVIGKIERLARATGLSKTAAVERAVDQLLHTEAADSGGSRMQSLLAQLDRIPDLAVPADPLDWDEHGLPR